jgi:hypothetical protein
MPLDKSGSKASIGNNIRAELSAGKPRRQAIAIALDIARRAKRASGGMLSQADWVQRAEAHSLAKSPVLKNLAQANTPQPLAIKGNPINSTPLGQMMPSSKIPTAKTNFPKPTPAPKLPTAIGKPPKMKNGGLLHGVTPGRADKINTSVPNNTFIIPAHVVSALGQGNTLAGAAVLDKMFPAQRKNGGKVEVALSDGEYRVDPQHVLRVGNGDFERGHRILKHFCEHVTHQTIEHLKHLPSPVDSDSD